MYWFAIAMSPAIAMVWFFYARNAYRPESKYLIAVLFVLGGASTMAALGLNHLVEKYTLLWPGAQATGIQGACSVKPILERRLAILSV